MLPIKPLHIVCIFLLLGGRLLGQAYYPLNFVENKGQWEGSFQFRAEQGNGALFIGPDGYTILQHHPEDYQKIAERLHGRHATEMHDHERPYRNFAEEELLVRSHALRISYKGSSSTASVRGNFPREGYDNYFIGDDPMRWKSEVRTYRELLYQNVYAGIDIRYQSEGGQLKYDLIVAPGADPGKIIMEYAGAEKISIKNGELVVATSVGVVKDLAPYAYQVIDGVKKVVDCQFSVSGKQVSYKIKGHDKRYVLVIDPTLVFSTYSGSRSGNFGFTATPGEDGSFFAGGIVFNGGGYPTTSGAFQTRFQGGGINLGVDIAITRISPNGDQRIYSTYLGGSLDEFPHSMFADPDGNLVVLGRTSSTNYPTTSTLGSLGSFDIIVTKLNAAGTALIGSMRIGGSQDDGANIDASGQPQCGSLLYNYGDNARSEVVLDAVGNIYIATSTLSTNFPLQNAIQTTSGGKQDAVLMKFTPDLSAVLFSTYLGGAEDDAGFVLALNPSNGDILLSGATASDNLPRASNGYSGQIDGYLAVFSANGSLLKDVRYFGTNAMDIIYGVQFDANGFPYIMGVTLGNWPVVNARFSNPGSKQFISKLRKDLSGYVYSTVYGTASSVPNISPVAFLVDNCENVYVSGWGGRLNLCSNINCYDTKTSGTDRMPIPNPLDAIKSNTDGRDFYFFVLEKDANSQLYGSFFGQTGGEGDHVDGGTSRFDKRGAIYMAICANCLGNNACQLTPITQPMQVTPGVIAPVNGAIGSGSGGDCNLAAVKISFDYQGVIASVQSAVDNIVGDSTGCVPMNVEFIDSIANAKNYEWNFGDGSPSVTTNDPITNHRYTRPGRFLVRLIAINNEKCIPRDTAYKTIIVRSDNVKVDFTDEKLLPCEKLSYQFTNLTVPPAGTPFGPKSFLWDFGDNSPRIITGTGNINHVYTAPGTYNVKLVMIDTNYCNFPDSSIKTIRVSSSVSARFTTVSSGCAPLTAQFSNISVAGETYIWDFGDGTTFTGPTPPPKVYNNVGTYTVRLIAIDPNTCNLRDTATTSLTVFPSPLSRFVYSPNPPQENLPVDFSNRSQGAISYRWSFGDGDTSLLTNPSHLYLKSGQFRACLRAINNFGCVDTSCQPIAASVVSLVDVPSAFSPNGDGVNDKIQVRGFGLSSINFRIYNRQGLLLFQTADLRASWDGYFKGVLQPMDVYVYTLEADFFDGSRVTKKGDITLLR